MGARITHAAVFLMMRLPNIILKIIRRLVVSPRRSFENLMD
jgi:hypothetical protein